MSFTIEFLNLKEEYFGGEQVACTIQITTDEDVLLKSIDAKLYWKTCGVEHSFGQGTWYEKWFGSQVVVENDAVTLNLSKDVELKSGKSHCFDVNFIVPTMPLSFEGQKMRLQYFLNVTLNPSFGFDYSEDMGLQVLPGEIPQEFLDVPDLQPTQHEEIGLSSGEERYSRVEILKFSIPQIIISLILLLISTPVVAVLVSASFMLIFFIPFVVILMAGFFLRRKILSDRLSTLQVQLPTDTVYSGTEVPIKVVLTPTSTFRINSIQSILRGAEVTTQIMPKYSKLFAHVRSAPKFTVLQMHYRRFPIFHYFVEQVDVVQDSILLEKGREYIFEQVIQVPESNAYSVVMNAEMLHVHWDIALKIDMPWFPNWTLQRNVNFLPKKFIDETVNESSESI